MNKLYPTFMGNMLVTLLGGTAEAVPTPELKFVAVDDSYVFDEAHASLDDILPSSVLATSIALSGTLGADGSLLLDPATDIFERSPLTACNAIVLVADWGTTSQLILYMDSWANTGVPFTAPTTVDLSFTDNFVFRLGNIGQP